MFIASFDTNWDDQLSMPLTNGIIQFGSLTPFSISVLGCPHSDNVFDTAFPAIFRIIWLDIKF